MSHLDSHQMLNDAQRHESQFILTVQDLTNDLNDSEQINAVLLDFSKAFDKVPHKLLEKLRHYGMSEKQPKPMDCWLPDWPTTRSGPRRCLFQGNRHHIRRAPGDSTGVSTFPCVHKCKWYARKDFIHCQIVRWWLTGRQNYTAKERSGPSSRRLRQATGMGTWLTDAVQPRQMGGDLDHQEKESPHTRVLQPWNQGYH